MTKASFLRSRWFEDIPVGEFHVFGSYTFSEQEMVDFGTAYAPQSYHTDPDAAMNTRYKGLIASNWHICSIWMRLMVDYMEGYSLGVVDGRRNGAGLGFQELNMSKHVRPCHTLTFSHEIIEKSNKIVQNKWCIIKSRNEAFNHKGELVMSFIIDILAERNPENL